MINFIQKLKKGIYFSELLNDEKEQLQELRNLRVLKEKKGHITLLPDYAIGRIDISRDGTGYLDEIGSHDRDLIVEREDLGGAQKGDIVVAKKRKKRRGRSSAKIFAFLQRSNSATLCYLQKFKRDIVGIDIKTETTIDLPVSQKALKQLPPNCVIKIDNGSGEIVEVLGVLDDPKVDEKISLHLFNKKEFFERRSEVEAESYGDSVDKSMYPDRVDLTHLPFCTIDPVSAKDHDDAIYFDVKEHTIYVAIADVSEYVTPNSSIDKEAKERGFSIYLPHKSIPMLPRTLSENICSLKEREDRLAFVYKIKIHRRTLQPIDEELFEAVINSKRKYSYEQIDEFLEDGECKRDTLDKLILESLLPLFELTQKLRDKRLKNGYDFFSDEQRMVLDENQNLAEITTEKETPSHSLIEECMLLANVASAKMFDVGIFRIHEEPDEKKIDDLLNDLALIGVYPKKSKTLHAMIQSIQKEADRLGIREDVDRMIIRSQSQAVYSAKNCGHFGLGFDRYTHFTSPIRRYSDLVLHRLLKSILKDSKEKEYILKQIEEIAADISKLERESAKVEWDYKDRKYARWAQEHLGKIVEGVVLDKEKMPLVKVYEEIPGMRIFIRGEHELERLNRVKVRITDANVATTRVEGTIEGIVK